MKRIFLATPVFILIISLTACLKPDAIDSTFASDVYLMDILETGAYARDVYVADGTVFVAASQLGNQIWQEQTDGTMEKTFEHKFSGDPALRMIVEPESGLMFTFDRAQGYFKKLAPDLSGFDSVYALHQASIENNESGDFGSGANEDFAVRKLNDSLIALYVIDRTSNDGFKQYYFNRYYHAPEPLYTGVYYYWEDTNVGTPSGGINLGLDLRGTLVGISHDELGVGLYRLDGVELDTLAVVDTPGEALEVKFYDNYLLSANNWAGMGVFALGTGDSSLTHLADVEVGGWVKQISIWHDIAVLSCGENGIFLVDLSDPENPEVDQPIDAGYTYRTHVAGDIIYAATREGVKRYQIESR
ncbi:MAG: hypothetical protein K9M55_03410 [Candidatus Marinimicrobia bacterium]|nr:hypothetical protein [Candidatus Neomarinimicrobiota bacterium]MCF7921726.1 hypothetical protein [Candidatus Neomarinimicrobiota bacterium]